MRRAALLLPLLALVLVVAGCGGGQEAAPLPETVVGTVPQATTNAAPTSTVEGNPAKGGAVWTAAGCGGCHTLAAAGSSGSIGPNLDDAKPDLALVLDRVTNGRGAMPSFRGQLSEQQLADVAAYVVSSTSG